MSSEEVREKFLKFFEERGHTVVPSSSLIPDDKSVLLTSAGMQQFKDYYTGGADPVKDFGSKNTVSIQKSFRTTDIEEVGDETHLTLLEMMGNFSFGGYFKKEAIKYAHDFITKEMGLDISYVTVFEGSHGVPKDEESRKIWNDLGVEDVREEGIEDVFWGPTGNSGPCGPTTEIYCKDGDGNDVELWNIVFNEYLFPGSREELLAGDSGKELTSLETPGVDTGMGFERLMAILGGHKNIYETDLFKSLTKLLPEELEERSKRIIADHIRGSAFLIADGVRPSKEDAGYILRDLLRRILVYNIQDESIVKLFHVVQQEYGSVYPELDNPEILDIAKGEFEKGKPAMEAGLKEVRRMYEKEGRPLTPMEVFRISSTLGVRYPTMKDSEPEAMSDTSRSDFEAERLKHREISRAGLEKKFGGHGLVLDTGELKAGDEAELKKVTRLHTATHLMQAALRDVLGDEVHQRGSDITSERTRFDFTFPRKVTREELDEVEKVVNEVVEKDLPFGMVEMSLEEARESGALYVETAKYPETVKVYYSGESLEDAFSKEICGGPHVTHTGEVGKFVIKKEKAVSAGVRRVRADVA